MADEKKEYALLPDERAVLLNLNQAVVQRKLAVYDLNMALERATKERDGAEALFSGALAMLAGAHGLAGGELAPDFTVIKART